MNEKDREPNFARALFERAVQGLDPATANRLRLARRAALAGPAPRWPGLGPGVVAATSAAAAVVVALGLSWWRPASDPGAPPAAAVATDDEVLVVVEGEDEIYAWLAEAPVAAEADAAPEQAL